MKSRKLSRGVLIAGVLLLILSAAWPYLLPKGVLWDDARAVELTNASEALHETMHAHGQEHDEGDFTRMAVAAHPEVEKAADKYRESQAELDSAMFWTDSVPIYLRWTGLAACIAGVVAFYGFNDRRPSKSGA